MEPLSHESVARVFFMPLSSMLLLLVMITGLSSLSLAECYCRPASEPGGIWTINLGSEQVTAMIRQHESRLIEPARKMTLTLNAVDGLACRNEVELRLIYSSAAAHCETAIFGEQTADHSRQLPARIAREGLQRRSYRVQDQS